jgi:hypothetical protein
MIAIIDNLIMTDLMISVRLAKNSLDDLNRMRTDKEQQSESEVDAKRLQKCRRNQISNTFLETCVQSIYYRTYLKYDIYREMDSEM